MTNPDLVGGWLAAYIVAVGGGFSLARCAWRAGGAARDLTLVAWLAGVQLPLMEVGYITNRTPGALGGLVVGLILSFYPLPVASLLSVGAAVADPDGRVMSRVDREVVHRVPRATVWGWTALLGEMALVGVGFGMPLALEVRGLGLVALVWIADGIATPDGPGRRAAKWVSESMLRIACAYGAIGMILPAIITFGLRDGSPTWRALNAYVTRHLAVSSSPDILGVATGVATMLGLALAAAAFARATYSQTMVIVVGTVVPFALWLLAAKLLPRQAADFAVWGIGLSTAVLFALIVVLLAGRSLHSEAERPPD